MALIREYETPQGRMADYWRLFVTVENHRPADAKKAHHTLGVFDETTKDVPGAKPYVEMTFPCEGLPGMDAENATQAAYNQVKTDPFFDGAVDG